jgi:hypothetical protein
MGESGAMSSPLARVRRAVRGWFGGAPVADGYRAPVLFFAARKHGIAYLQVPKAACTSLRAAICLLNHPELDPGEVTSDEWIHETRKLNDILRPGAAELEKLFRFTFVRHPYARFVSFYRNKVAKPESPAMAKRFAKQGFTGGMSVEAALDVIEATPVRLLDPHLIPQTDLVYRGGSALVEYIGKVEQLGEHIKVVEKRAGISLNLPHLNRAAGAGIDRAREFLTEQARARLRRIYSQDFERFAYEP